MSSSNCPMPTYQESAEFMQLISHSLLILTFPINLYGIYLICFKTPFRMKNMKMAMLNAHFWAFISDMIIGTMTIPYILMPLISGVPIGIFSTLLKIDPFVQAFIAIGVIGEVSASVVFLLENKQHQTVHGKFRIDGNFARTVFITCNMLVILVVDIPVFILIPEQVSAKLEIVKLDPCQPLQYLNLDIIVVSNDSVIIGYILLFIMLFFTIQVAFFGVHACINLFCASQHITFSNRTRKLQRKYFISLILQISVPFTIFVIPIGYFIFSIATDYHNQFLNNLSVLVISTHGFISTITTISIYEHYRTVTINLILCRKNPLNKVFVATKSTVETVFM